MKCKYVDCGWCYADKGVTTNAVNGGCYKPTKCPEHKKQRKAQRIKTHEPK